MLQGDPEVLSPTEIAANVDGYLARFPGGRKRIARLALVALEWYPLLSFRPRFSRMSAQRRRAFIRKKFERDIRLRRVLRPLRFLVQALIRFTQQLVYLGYYSDPRTFASVGYVPYSRRPGRPQPPRVRVPLEVLHPEELGPTLTAEVCVIGSGAGGAMVAHSLGALGVPDVLVVDRGPFVQPADFVEDELEMLARLYADGALQMSRDFRVQVLQGCCIGGTTVVNNAVCFDLPEGVLSRWNAPDLAAGLDANELRGAFHAVRELIHVRTQPSDQLNRGAPLVVHGVERLRASGSPYRFGVVAANIHECLGCGYCNIGCAYGKKLSMLDTILPWAQRDFKVRIVEQCEVRTILARGRRALAAVARLPGGRRVEIHARAFVVSCGALASSQLLWQSRLGGPNVGRRVSLNLGSPLVAKFHGDPLNSFDGLQISHYLEPEGVDDGFILETWYNPPVAQALTMPGWFEQHFQNMRDYAHLTAIGVLVGTEPNGRVSRGLLGRDLRYTPTRRDLDKVLRGLQLAGRVFFAAGADRVMPATFAYHEFRDADSLDALPRLVRDATDITLGSGHPQGGNMLSGRDDLGVVTQDFRVRGTDNVFVCDASVFPSSIGVNPQLTVMALARYAAPRIAAHLPAGTR